VAINDTLPLKAARRDEIANLKAFWGFESELQTNSKPFYLDSPWGATLMPLTTRAIMKFWDKTPRAFQCHTRWCMSRFV